MVEKTIHCYNWVTLAAVLFLPAFLLRPWGPIVNTALLTIVLSAFTIDLFQKRGMCKQQYATLMCVIFQAIYCILLWLVVTSGLQAQWLLAELVFLLVSFYILTCVQKQVSVSDMQTLIELLVCIIVTYVRIM